MGSSCCSGSGTGSGVGSGIGSCIGGSGTGLETGAAGTGTVTAGVEPLEGRITGAWSMGVVSGSFFAAAWAAAGSGLGA